MKTNIAAAISIGGARGHHRILVSFPRQCVVWLVDMDNLLLRVKLTVFFHSLKWRFVINISI